MSAATPVRGTVCGRHTARPPTPALARRERAPGNGACGAARPRGALALLLAGCCAVAVAETSASVVPFEVTGDAITTPLNGRPGDAARGRAIVANRRVGLCLLCHSGPFPEERFQGTLAPSLAGAGARWTAGQLRLRIADPRRLNPETLMPSYHRVTDLHQVGAAYQGRPVLDAQQIEDVVAFLQTLRD